jgi:hypothetical protein
VAREPKGHTAHQPILLSPAVNYEGTEALLAVLDQPTVTDADIDKLLAIHAIQAMVNNTTKYIPADTRATFRAALKEFVTTRRSTIGHFALDESAERSAEIRALLAELKANANTFLPSRALPLPSMESPAAHRMGSSSIMKRSRPSTSL